MRLSLLLFAFAAQTVASAEPGPDSIGEKFSVCIHKSLPNWDDGRAEPAIVARQTLSSCGVEIAAFRAKLREAVSIFSDPDEPEAMQIVDDGVAELTSATEQGIISEVARRRKK